MNRREIVWLALLVTFAAAALWAGLHFRAKARAYELHEAMLDGDLAEARSLIKAGANPNVRAFEGKTALHMAIGAGDLEMVLMLFEEGADCSCKDASGTTPAVYAFLGGEEEIYDLLKARGCSEQIDERHATELLASHAMYGERRDAAFLLDHGARADRLVGDDDWGRSTAVHFAVSGMNWELIDLFVERGADINVLNSEGQTSLDEYLLYRKLRLWQLKRLVDRGARSTTYTKAQIDAIISAELEAGIANVLNPTF